MQHAGAVHYMSSVTLATGGVSPGAHVDGVVAHVK